MSSVSLRSTPAISDRPPACPSAAPITVCASGTFAGQHRGDGSSAHHRDAIAHAENLRQIAGDHQRTASFLRRPGGELFCGSPALAPTSTPWVGCVENQKAFGFGAASGRATLSAGCHRERHCPVASGPDALIAEVAHEFPRQCPLRAEAQPSSGKELFVNAPSSCCARWAFRESRHAAAGLPEHRRCRAPRRPAANGFQLARRAEKFLPNQRA